MLLAVAAAVTTLMMVMLPSTASAEPNPGDVTAERTVMAVDVAVDRELDFAVRGTLPPRSELTCRISDEPARAEVCYEKNGDRWWVWDGQADGASALVFWFNYPEGGAAREGFCVNSLGHGVWGQCNKNYGENSELEGYPCAWDRSAGGIEDEARCSDDHWVFQ
jgi:hypothetical protein